MYSTIQIFEGMDKSEPERSYLLVGEEGYLKEEGLNRILAKTLPEGTAVFDKVTLHGDSATAEEIMSALSSIPMMASKRVVIIRDVNRLDANTKNRLLNYLDQPSSSTCLFLLAPKVDLGKGFFSKASKIAKLYDFRKLTRGESSRLLVSRLREHEMTITQEARELLLEGVGSDTFKLMSELDKLILYKNASKRIDRDDVEKLTSSERLQKIFKLQDLVGRKNARDALAIIEQLLCWNEKPMRILASLGSFYLTLLRLKQEPKNPNWSRVAGKLGLSSFYLRKCAVHLPHFSEKELISALDLTNRKELEIKEGAICFRSLLTTYIHQLCSL